MVPSFGLRAVRSRTPWIFLLLFLTYAGFFQASTWGAACRLDLARALFERGTLSIDAYHRNTGDKALVDGHYYSDKAPLPSFLAVPGVALAHAIRALTGKPVSNAVWLAMMGGLAAAWASGLVTALGGVFFYRILREREMTEGAAALATLFVFLGTTLFPYATVLQQHAPAAAWLVVFFWGVFPGKREPSFRRAAVAGVAASAALATEYLTGPPLVVLGVVALARQRAAAGGLLGALVLGALPGLVLLGWYHDAAFGSPFSLGYQHVALPFFREKMAGGFFGIGVPDPLVAVRLLCGAYRGLFFACPVLLAAIGGLVLLLRDRARRTETLAALFVPLFYWLLSAGYSTWSGGWAIGPRHLVAGIPFLGLGLGVALMRWRRVVIVLGALSVFLMLATTSVQPEVPEDIGNPLFEYVLPNFLRGEFSVGEQSFADYEPQRLDPAEPDRWDAFLIGEALRLPGLLALLPVLLVWGVLGSRLWTNEIRRA
jgi:hypothetical protein